MKIEAGKYYRTRDGRKAGPIKTSGDGGCTFAGKLQGYYFTWARTGRWVDDHTIHPRDLVAEWEDEPARQDLIDKINGLEAKLDAALHQLWNAGGDPREWVRTWCADFAAKKEKPKPRKGTVWLNVWEGEPNLAFSAYRYKESAESHARTLIEHGHGMLVRAMPVEWTEDE